jgi:hypothetical protein
LKILMIGLGTRLRKKQRSTYNGAHLTGQADYMINFGITERKRQELEQRMHNCNLLENDIEETFIRSGGAGGPRTYLFYRSNKGIIEY